MREKSQRSEKVEHASNRLAQLDAMLRMSPRVYRSLSPVPRRGDLESSRE